MSTLVVYESMFGNTQSIAKEIALGLSSRLSVETYEVGAAPKVVGPEFELVVVGGPTHVFGMSRPRTREDAAGQTGHPVVVTGIGMREWLATVQGGSGSTVAAAFDTRVNKPRLPGSAARAAEKRLRRLGFRIVVSRESFYVDGTEGPLVEGELERARQWGENLATMVSAATDRPLVS